MKTLTFIIGSILCSNLLFSQKIISVTEQAFKIGSMKTEETYFRFAAGEQVVINFSDSEKKDFRLEILKYRSNSKLAEFKTGEVENKTINIFATGVYRLRLYNDAIVDRECKIKVQRIHVPEETQVLTTNVTSQKEYDTSYYAAQEQYLVKQEYVSQQVIPLTRSYIDGSSDIVFAGGKSRILFPIKLPENTVEWYYQVSAFRDTQQVKEATNIVNLAPQLSSLINQKEGLNFGPDALPQPDGAAFFDVYVMDSANAIQFEAGNDYQYSLAGSNQNIKSVIAKVYGGSSTPLYLGLRNPEAANGLSIVWNVWPLYRNNNGLSET